MKTLYIKTLISLSLLLSPIVTFCQDLLEYKYKEGDQLQLYSEVTGYTRASWSKPYTAKGKTNMIQTCIKIEETPNSTNPALKDTSCIVDTRYNSIEEIDGAQKNANSATTKIKKDKLGYETIIEDNPIKSILGFPVFPNRKVAVGDIWTSKGKIRHQNLFGTKQKILMDVDVRYEYIDRKMVEGRPIAIILVTWNMEYSTRSTSKTELQIINFNIDSYGEYQFDIENGREYYYSDDFNTTIIFNTDESIDIESESFTRVDYMNIKQEENHIAKAEKELKDANIDLKETDGHIFLNVSDISFDVNSVSINAETEARLKVASSLLEKYKGRNILILGHTSYENYGTDKQHEELSEKRALSVVNFLLENKVADKEHISYKGMGHSKPLFPNDTPEHTAKNRRIEIIVE